MSFGAGAEVWAAGVAAGLTGDVFVDPMETIITRVQSPAYTTRYKSLDGRLKGTLFLGLYQGFGPTLVAGIPSSAAFFAVYEGMKSAFQDMQADGYLQELPPSAVHVASSGAAELVHCAISNPAEVLKQNAQVQQGSATPKPLGWYTLQVFRTFARHPSKLWTGYSALLASNLPGTCITFGLYEYIKERLLNSLSKNGQQATALMQVQVSALSAGLAGGFTSRPDQRPDAHGSRKRRRAERFEAEELLNDTSDDFPGSFDGDGIYDILDDLLDAYFSHIQPWIPMINMRDFRARARRDNDHALKVVLQAMAVACLRYVERDGELLPTDYVTTETRRLRRLVLLDALDGLTVENLQALTMIAFTDIGDGNLDKAWPIIGSLTRTVEYMELSVETEDRQQRPAVLPSPSCLSPPVEWVEEEERRRVFWNIFILDRSETSSLFVSELTSLDSHLWSRAADVCRRLPICGGRWFEDDPAVTPYFGIWDRSRARIGNSITFLPGHYRALLTRLREKMQIQNFKVLRLEVKALPTKIDFKNRHEVSNWLTRFKELDLRLVHWKMYLPQQWKDSGVSRETMPGVMDPNMTVANATHNISLILLHQRIAYPDAELGGIRLPSLCSADTCYTAAIETANITTKYLEGASHKWPVSPQLGICAFAQSIHAITSRP
ncbi:hypothetical protein FALBO_2341 [Fusarium albosuccineum]|uniref:Xylanolytic transcriptional activator regulatory domain-containing protein n=1 Tax=Fusarium albosuccineum TaxID=1237068 RepID=A0A8H4LJI3_9HYPO|nr:hypothetical protein FALBO_2341 [Fusarium albosuccineum]